MKNFGSGSLRPYNFGSGRIRNNGNQQKPIETNRNQYKPLLSSHIHLCFFRLCWNAGKPIPTSDQLSSSWLTCLKTSISPHSLSTWSNCDQLLATVHGVTGINSLPQYMELPESTPCRSEWSYRNELQATVSVVTGMNSQLQYME